MNHYQDIDEGKATYDEECTRAEFESSLSAKPELFAFTFPDGACFEPKTVRTLHLHIDHTPNPAQPFDFEEGYAAIEGTVFNTSGVMEMRWGAYGRVHEERFTPA